MTCACAESGWRRRVLLHLWSGRLALLLLIAAVMVGCKSEGRDDPERTSQATGASAQDDAVPSGSAASGGAGVSAAGVSVETQSLGPQCLALAALVTERCANPPLGEERWCLGLVQALDGYRAEPEGSEAACAVSLSRLETGAVGGGPGVVLAEPHPPEHVMPGPRERPTESESGKAQRVLRVIANYLVAHAAEHGAPADQGAAAAVLLESHGMEWPKDPWGLAYAYRALDERHFELSSAGPDGESGTEDDLRVTE